MTAARLVVGSALVVGLAALSLAGGATTAAPADVQKAVVEMATGPPHFTPAEITVAPGSTVVWRTVSGSHTTTSEAGLWDSVERLPVGQSFPYTFQDPGEYGFYCQPHQDQGMVGKVIVIAGR